MLLLYFIVDHQIFMDSTVHLQSSISR